MMIYLDNAATTRPFDSVCDIMDKINREVFANTSALHSFGFEAEKIITESRKIIAETLYVKPDTITFTSGGTESNNIAIMGYLKANPRTGKHIITSSIEHPSVLEIFRYLVSMGYKITVLDTDENGIIDYEQLEDVLNSETSLISIMMVNNEIGSIQDFSKIKALRNKLSPKAVIHSDCVQAFGKININPEKSGIDLLSISGHKIYGPKGTGVMYAKKGIKVFPVMYGGGHEEGLRSGTLNTPAIAGMGEAAKIISDNITNNFIHVEELKKLMIEKLLLKSVNFVINGDLHYTSPYILNLSFPGVKAQVLLNCLAEKKIYVSSGSACSSNSKKKKYSHVLSSVNASADVIDSSIRLSFSHYNTSDEIETTVEEICHIIPEIKYK